MDIETKNAKTRELIKRENRLPWPAWQISLLIFFLLCIFEGVLYDTPSRHEIGHWINLAYAFAAAFAAGGIYQDRATELRNIRQQAINREWNKLYPPE